MKTFTLKKNSKYINIVPSKYSAHSNLTHLKNIAKRHGQEDNDIQDGGKDDG